jgi:hypothetical protein
LKIQSINEQLQIAKTSNQIVDRKNQVEEVQKMLLQIMYFRDRIITRLLENSDDQNQDRSQIRINLDTINVGYDDNPIEQIIVPNSIRPYINRQIDFDLFNEIMTERVDQQRIKIGLDQFLPISFKRHGLPQVFYHLARFFLRLEMSEVVDQKLRQLYTT